MANEQDDQNPIYQEMMNKAKNGAPQGYGDDMGAFNLTPNTTGPYAGTPFAGLPSGEGDPQIDNVTNPTWQNPPPYIPTPPGGVQNPWTPAPGNKGIGDTGQGIPSGYSPDGTSPVKTIGTEGAPTTQSPSSSNQYGNSVNLDPAYIDQQISKSYADAHGGAQIPAALLAQERKYALTPDTYSDGNTRVGWNPYLADRMNKNSASSDPRLAGDEGIIHGVAGAGSGAGSLLRPFGSGIDSSQSNNLFSLLMDRAKQSLNVNRNDPAIRRQVDAYGATQDRARRSFLQDLAEQGGPNANISAETRSSAEKAGQNTAGFEGQIMQQEINARRQEIMSALSGAQGLLTAEQQMALQEELQQMSLAQNAYQFDTNQEYLRSPVAGGQA